MKTPPILVSLDTNEAHRPRAEKIEKAVEADDHFLLWKVEDLSFDMQFKMHMPCGICDQGSYVDPLKEPEGFCRDSDCPGAKQYSVLNVELKDFTGDHNSDYVNSIIDQEGHLYQQVLAGRELRDPLVIVVLGGDAEVSQAIVKAVTSRGFKGNDAVDKIIEYTHLVEGFEANCEGCNIRVWRLKDNPYKRMLLRARKIIQGGDLTGFRPAPAEGERRAVGLSLLCGNGIGPAKSESILERFKICLEPKGPDIYLEDCAGIGPKLAAVVQMSLCVSPLAISRPKVRKLGKRANAGGD